MSAAERPDAARRPDRAALLIAIGLGLAGIVVLASTASMASSSSYARIGPTTVPYIVGVCLLLLAAWTAWSAWQGEFPEREPQQLSPVLWIVAGLIAQMVLLKPIGFSVGTGLLFAATARGFGRGPLWLTIPIGIVISFVIWVIFAKGLQLSLPAGPVERLL
jgi:putative tricarboxylic transport membrane protein